MEESCLKGAGDCLYAFALDRESLALLRIGLDGRTRLIPVEGDIIDSETLLLPSPDGNQFVFAKRLRESTIWMLENP